MFPHKERINIWEINVLPDLNLIEFIHALKYHMALYDFILYILIKKEEI